MKKRTKTFLLLTATVIFSIIVAVIVYYDMNNSYQKAKVEMSEIQSCDDLVYEVNNISTNDYIILQGYAYFAETESTSDVQIGLYDDTTNELIKLSTVVESVPDVGNVGFYAKISKDKLNLKKSYDIVLIYNGNEYYNFNEVLED